MFGSFTDSLSLQGQKAEIATEVKEPETLTTDVQVENNESESAPEQNTEASKTSDAASDNDSEDGEDTSNEVDSDGKPRKGFLRRVEKLNNKIRERDQEIEYWKKVALGQNPNVPTESKSAEVAVTQNTASKPKFEDYNDIEAYTEAVTEWKLDQKLAALEQRKTVDNVAKTYETRLEEFKKTATDFDAVFQEFVEDYGQIQIPEIVQVAMESEHGPAIAYYIAKNPAEVERISKLPPHKRLLEMGKIEAKVSQPVTTINKQEETKKVSKAPAPVETVKGTGKVESTDLRSITDYQEFVRMREKQLKRK